MAEGLVIEIERDIIQSNSDVVSALRKAHVLATKLELTEFDNWVQNELNGYKCPLEEVPEYRTVRAALKAFNPMVGWIPTQIANPDLEKTICEQVLPNSISELIKLCEESKSVVNLVPTGAQGAMLSKAFGYETQYVFDISTHVLNGIIEKVKNTLLDWALKLEGEGIEGKGMSFTEEEKVKAKGITDGMTVVLNPKAENVSVITGSGNTINFNYKDAENAIQEIKKAVEDTNLSSEDRETAEELLKEISEKLAAKESPSIIKALLLGLKDFLINAGGNAAGTIIAMQLQGLF